MLGKNTTSSKDEITKDTSYIWDFDKYRVFITKQNFNVEIDTTNTSLGEAFKLWRDYLKQMGVDYKALTKETKPVVIKEPKKPAKKK